MTKKIAVYGNFEVRVPFKQRYWLKRKDGVKQRYLKKTRQLKKVTKSGRYEFSGQGRDLRKAVVKAHRIVPKGYVDVSAEKFLKNPEEYGSEGFWIDREVESR